MMIGFAIISLPFAGANGQGLGGSLHRLPDLIRITTRVVHCCLILELLCLLELF